MESELSLGIRLLLRPIHYSSPRTVILYHGRAAYCYEPTAKDPAHKHSILLHVVLPTLRRLRFTREKMRRAPRFSLVVWRLYLRLQFDLRRMTRYQVTH